VPGPPIPRTTADGAHISAARIICSICSGLRKSLNCRPLLRVLLRKLRCNLDARHRSAPHVADFIQLDAGISASGFQLFGEEEVWRFRSGRRAQIAQLRAEIEKMKLEFPRLSIVREASFAGAERVARVQQNLVPS